MFNQSQLPIDADDMPVVFDHFLSFRRVVKSANFDPQWLMQYPSDFVLCLAEDSKQLTLYWREQQGIQQEIHLLRRLSNDIQRFVLDKKVLQSEDDQLLRSLMHCRRVQSDLVYHSNARLFLETLLADFRGELNYLRGHAHSRSGARETLLGTQANEIYRNLRHTHSYDEIPEPNDLLVQESATHNHFLIEDMRKAGMLFLQILSEQEYAWDQLNEDEVEQLAVSGVDRVLEYMTCPNTMGYLPSWSPIHYLLGLIEGDGRRWAFSLLTTSIISSHVQNSPSIEAFYALDPKVIMDAWRRYAAQEEIGVEPLEYFYDQLYDEVSEYSSEQHRIVDAGIKALSVALLQARCEGMEQNNPLLANLKLGVHRMRYREVEFPSDLFDPKLSLQTMVLPYPPLMPMVVNTQGASLALNQFMQTQIRGQVAPANGFASFITAFFLPMTQYGLLRVGQGYEKEAEQLVWSALQNSRSNEFQYYTPFVIRVSELVSLKLDYTQPFLPQYFQQALGYTARGVQHLKTHYRFFFLLVGLDSRVELAANEAPLFRGLLDRLYAGEETSDWPACKVLFFASPQYQPAPRRRSTAIVEATLSLTVPSTQVAQVVAQGPIHESINWVYANLERLSPMMQAFDMTAQDTFVPPAATHAKLSIVLMNVVLMLRPYLENISQDDWPNNRHALFAFAFRQVLGENYRTFYPRLQQLALTLFQRKQMALEEAAATTEKLDAWPIISVEEIYRHDQVFYRYTFNEASARDYLIAEALWQQRYAASHNPETLLWNQAILANEYPWVLYFVVEKLRHSDSRLLEATFLYRRWVANGSLLQWESAFHNVKHLLDHSRFAPEEKSRFQQAPQYPLLGQLAPAEDEAQQVALIVRNLPGSIRSQLAGNSAFLQATTAEVVAKIHLCEQFLVVRAHRYLRYAQKFSRGQGIFYAPFLAPYGHSGGITAASPRYHDDARLLQQERHFIAVNSVDQRLGSKLLDSVYAAIETASPDSVDYIYLMLPQQVGLEQRKLGVVQSRLSDVIALLSAERDYVEELRTVKWIQHNADKARARADALKRWQAHQRDRQPIWLDNKIAEYTAECWRLGRWFTLEGVEVEANLFTVTARVGHYKNCLRNKLQQFNVSVPAVINDQTRNNHCLDEVLIEVLNEIDNALILHRQKIAELAENKNPNIQQEIAGRYLVLLKTVLGTAHSLPSMVELQQLLKAGGIDGLIAEFNHRFRPIQVTDLGDHFLAQVSQQLTHDIDQWFREENGAAPFAGWADIQQQWRNTHKDVKQYIIWSIRTGQDEMLNDCLRQSFKRVINGAGDDFYLMFVNTAYEIRARVITRCIEQWVLTQSLTALTVWEALSIAEKGKIFQVFDGYCRETGTTSIDPLLVIFDQYPGLLLSPSTDYLGRYLRFGLSVDAASVNKNPLLLAALEKLVQLKAVVPTQAFLITYKIIKYLINLGAAVSISSTLARDQDSLANYVNTQYQNNQNNAYWHKIKLVVQMISRWETDPTAESRYHVILQKMGNLVVRYEQQFFADNWVTQIGRWLRSATIQQDREQSIPRYLKCIETLRHDLFDIREGLEAIKNIAYNSPQRMGMGRLHGGILKLAEECLKLLPSQAELIAVTRGNATSHGVSFDAEQPRLVGQEQTLAAENHPPSPIGQGAVTAMPVGPEGQEAAEQRIAVAEQRILSLAAEKVEADQRILSLTAEREAAEQRLAAEKEAADQARLAAEQRCLQLEEQLRRLSAGVDGQGQGRPSSEFFRPAVATPAPQSGEEDKHEYAARHK